ncbi:MAG: hypothetical protein NVSMB60_11760 [Mycobacterium sp.]
MRTIEQVCAECDFDASKASPVQVAAALVDQVGAIVAATRSIPSGRVRARPAPQVWSPVEYLGHLRESMAFHRWLIEEALREDDPLVPMVDPDASVAAAGYGDADVDELLGQSDRRVQRLAELLHTIDMAAAGRTLTLGDDHISVALVARSA